MRKTIISDWVMTCWILFLSAVFSIEILAKLPASNLKAVQPMYGSPSGIRLQWERVSGAQGYDICGKAGINGCKENDINWNRVPKGQIVYADCIF